MKSIRRVECWCTNPGCPKRHLEQIVGEGLPSTTWAQIEPERVRGSFRPGQEILAEVETPWVFVRWVQKPEGQSIGFDGKEAMFIQAPKSGTMGIVPGVCVATNRHDVDEVIAALQWMRERLPP